MRVSVLLLCVVVCGQTELSKQENVTIHSLHNGLTEKIANFSLELLYKTAVSNPDENMIMSPFTVWTTLAAISEGATGNTRLQIHQALRLLLKQRDMTRQNIAEISQWLPINTTTVELTKFNGIFIHVDNLPLSDYRDVAKLYYGTDMVAVNFTDYVKTANLLNTVISNFTHGRISKIVESSYFKDASLVLTSGLYFKGKWYAPFNRSSTRRQPFYDSNGKQIGEVNMMYNRFTYPSSNINYLQARVIELPYGNENRLSMLIMVPKPGVSIERMMSNFLTVSLDSLFEELRLSEEENSDDEVDCYIPRFKIESDIDMTEVLRRGLGIYDLFDVSRALLPYMARTPLYVSKCIHKAEIEVTEEGTTASAVTVSEFTNRIGVVRFEANRPFAYMIIEKVTNSIVFGGFYKTPYTY